MLKQLCVAVLKAFQSVNGMMANAGKWLFWPRLDASIQQTKAQCQTQRTPDVAVKPRVPIPKNGYRSLTFMEKFILCMLIDTLAG